ncbi:energy-coupling factor ABC transporter substrate-binding protein [Streptomyces sp. ODS28]|uniref:energy-coupling factor ABC transporter substrate-binding protein n=1 Tax=Streptomyces sp. ODS28 TaxID=3136688 RepID=UPI0031EA6ACC
MSRNAKINTLLVVAVLALAVIPLAFGLGDHKKEPFTGSDAQAESAITQLKPDYKPWFSPLYEPPSGEVESALFALQAALGAGVLTYYFGLRRGRKQGEARALAAQREGTSAGTDTGEGDGKVEGEHGTDAADAGSAGAGTAATGTADARTAATPDQRP